MKLRAALLLAGLIGLAGWPAAGQSPRASIGASALALASDPAFAGLGPVVGVRLDRQLRLRAGTWLGIQGDDLASRAEGLIELVLDAGGRGWSPFGGGGLAVVAGRGDVEGYVVVNVGLEQRADESRGWWVEAGVGGGFRLGAGYRVPLRALRRAGMHKRPSPTGDGRSDR